MTYIRHGVNGTALDYSDRATLLLMSF